MTLNRNKQKGATLISWLIVAGFAVMMASAVIKVAPYYVEHYNVQKMMDNIASEPNAKKMNKRQIFSKVEKHLTINSLYGLEKAFYDSQSRGSKVDNPFSFKKLKKGKNRHKLSVKYQVPVKWIGNLSFLVNFKHSVIMGETNTVKANAKAKELDE